MAIRLILPLLVDGISIEALSLSSVMIPCSFTISSPSETNTSITSTLSKSPKSGTRISTTTDFFSAVLVDSGSEFSSSLLIKFDESSNVRISSP